MEPKALSTFRLGIDCWQNEDTFSRWLDSLEPFRHGFDDIALFTQMTHAVLSLEILKTNLQVVPERFAALRERGFGAGLNHLCTMGFFLENRRHVPRGIPFYINADGRPNPGRLCPSTPEYREKFMRPLMHLLAATHPDFIWLDDDNNGCCMCDFCMARFNARYQTRETRESLTASLVNGSWEERIAARKRFLEFAGETLSDYYAAAAAYARELVPGIELNGMNIIGDWYDSDNTAEWSRILAGPEHLRVRWRPGGGTWNDKVPDECILRKAQNMGMSAAGMPDTLCDRQSEIENFPGQRLNKSCSMTVLEACVYNFAGMTGTTWSGIDPFETPEVNARMLKAIADVRPLLDRQTAECGLKLSRGIWNGWSSATISALRENDAFWNGYSSLPENRPATEFLVSGFSPAYRLEDAELVMLADNAARLLDDGELRCILSGALYCDVPTLQYLTERGFGRQLGFRAVKNHSCDVRERLTAHPLNGTFAGSVRDGRQAFTHGDGWELRAVDGKGESLAELIDYDGKTVAECTLGLYENEWGGRVMVAGYYPYSGISCSSKLNSLKRAFEYLTRGGFTGWIESYHRIALWVRPGGIGLVNASHDRAEQVVLRWRTRERELELIGMDGSASVLTGEELDDGTMRFVIPEMECYRACWLHPRKNGKGSRK